MSDVALWCEPRAVAVKLTATTQGSMKLVYEDGDELEEEFAAYLKCGRLEHGFLRVRCEDCHAEKLVAFSCKRRGFCPSCGARRMPDSAALLAERIGRALERQGVLVRDVESSHLELGPDVGGPMDDLLGHSITYRVAVGPRAGQKVFSLQTVPARADGPRKGVVQYAGFSLHAGIGVEAEQREKLERLARYRS